jgi:hypothetical protein
MNGVSVFGCVDVIEVSKSDAEFSARRLNRLYIKLGQSRSFSEGKAPAAATLARAESFAAAASRATVAARIFPALLH